MASDRSSMSAFAKRAGLVLGSLLLVFAVGEIAVRLMIENARLPTERAKEPEAPVVPGEPDLPVFEGTLVLAQKNVRGIHKGVLVRTNSQALRGPDYAARAEAGVFRIAVGGDSVTMGEGVAEEATYVRQLQALLDERRPGQRHEVLNVGLSGSNAAIVMERLARAVAHYHPHMLVYGFTVNDIEGPSYVRGERSNELVKALQENPAARSPSWLVRLVWWQLQGLREPPDPRKAWYPRELHHNYFDNPAAWADFAQALDRFAAMAAEEGVCAPVFLHTHLSHLDERHPYQAIYDRVAEAARRRGLPVIRSLEAVRGLHPPDLWVGVFDPHPNARGHRIFAERLLEGLQALPPRCWQTADPPTPPS